MVKDIKGFESKTKISINLLATEGKEIYICRKERNYDHSINLMIINNHYVAIKSLSRLLSNKNSKHNGKEYFCTNCLQGFHQKIPRDEHMRYCLDNESVKVEMPRNKPIVEFCDGQYQFKVPFIMYADFESLLEPIQEPSKDPSGPWTTVTNNHIPSGWCVYSEFAEEFAYEKVKNPLTLYRGKDCVKKFCDNIIEEACRLYRAFPERPMAPLTLKEIEKHKKSKKCYICFRPFTLKDPKVRDHCHYTGNYRGAAHRNCNLQYKIPPYIPVVFHNLSGYDAHLFIRELAASKPGGAKMEVIAKSKEDYITFSIRVAVDKYIDKNGIEKEIELRFIDSFKFMSSGSDSLTTNLVRGDHRLFGFEEYTSIQYELLVKKGIYPYEYMSSWDKFKETKLPPEEAFYSKLNMVGVSSENYQHARSVWKEFEIKNLGEYHDLYLKTDVILLANVFEAFRQVCLKNYDLDPAHFYTTPELAWKACLKKTRIMLELLLDPEMLLMFERGIRGGNTQSVHRWAEANNPYMNSFNPNEKTSYLQYLECKLSLRMGDVSTASNWRFQMD